MKKILLLLLFVPYEIVYAAQIQKSQWQANTFYLNSRNSFNRPDTKSCDINRFHSDRSREEILRNYALVSKSNPLAIPFYNLQDVEDTIQRLSSEFDLAMQKKEQSNMEQEDRLSAKREKHDALKAKEQAAYEKYATEFAAAEKKITLLATELKEAYQIETKADAPAHDKVTLVEKILTTYLQLNSALFNQPHSIPHSFNETKKREYQEKIRTVEKNAYDWLPHEEVSKVFKKHQDYISLDQKACAFIGKKIYDLVLSLLFVPIEQEDLAKLQAILNSDKYTNRDQSLISALSNDATLAVELCMRIITMYNKTVVLGKKADADLTQENMTKLAESYWIIDANIQAGTTGSNTPMGNYITHRTDIRASLTTEPLKYMPEFTGLLESYNAHKEKWFKQICDIMQRYIQHAYKTNNFAAIQDFFSYKNQKSTFKALSDIVIFYNFNRSIFIKTLALPALFIHIRNDTLPEITKEQRNTIYKNLNLYCPFETFYFFRKNATKDLSSHKAVQSLLTTWDERIKAAIRKYPNSESWQRMQKKFPEAATIFTLWQAENQEIHRGRVLSQKTIPLFSWPQEQLAKWDESRTQKAESKPAKTQEEAKSL